MTRRPQTQPETVVRGNPPHHFRRTLRPAGPIPDVRDGNWIALRDAVEMLATVLPTPKSALDQIILAVMLDELPVTCRLLVYERADGKAEHQDRHSWPSSEARLGAQLLKARDPRASLKVSPESGNIQWADVTGDWPVQALMFSTHVDAETLLDIFRREVPDSAARPRKPYGRNSTEPEIKAWYSRRLAAAKEMGVRHSRDEDIAAGQAVGISAERVKSLRKDLAPPEWQKGGRPKGR